MGLEGNLIVGQSGGPTAVINASLAGVIEEAKKHSEIKEIYGAIHGVEGLLQEEIVDLRSESDEAVSLLRNTPASALLTCRRKLTEDDYEHLLSIFRAHNIRYFLYIGGNDSADTTHKVGILAQESGYEMRVMGVPKTVDNDLAYMDHTPGFGSVARFNALAMRDAGLDSIAMSTSTPIKIVETMGRNAGWITASTALAREKPGDPPDLIYLPERPFDHDRFLSDVKKVLERGRGCTIAVCEGLRDAEGNPVVASKSEIDTDAFGHRQLGGIGDYLARFLMSNLNLKARADKAGTIQRVCGFAQSSVDAAEAYMAGAAAVRHACEGTTAQMVTLVRVSNDPYKCETGLAPLSAVANAERVVPDEFISDEGNDVTPAFIDYALPLIGDPMPSYARLKLERIPKLLQT